MAAEIKNAVITGARITAGERGLLTVWLDLDYGGAGQCFGGWALYLPKSFDHHRMDSPAGHFVFRCMEVAGVEDWSRIVGKTIRVRADWNRVEAIGHIVKDDWFCPAEDFSPTSTLTPEQQAQAHEAQVRG